MVDKASISDRVYGDIKQLLQDGAYLPGDRIDATLLADRLRVSATPVRLALQRLAGERLTEFHFRDGFTAARITEGSLRDLFRWNLHLLHLALRLIMADKLRPPSSHVISNGDKNLVLSTERLFLDIADAAKNAELYLTVFGINDRLRLVRKMADGAIADREGELGALQALWVQHAYSDLQKQIAIYHDRRLHMVPDLVEAVCGRRH